jgi:hypothetical protein
MHDYGINPRTLMGLKERKGWYPDPKDQYNSSMSDLGNSYFRLGVNATEFEVIIPERPFV